MHWIYETVVPKNVYPLHHGASFYPLLVSFRLQIAYRKEINSQIGVNKLVGKVSINLLCHAKFIVPRKGYCVKFYYVSHLISIIIDAPAVSCTPKLIDLQTFVVTTAALLC